MLCEQTGVQFNVLLAAAEQHHRTMTLIASEASHAIFLEGPGGASVPGASPAEGAAEGPSPLRIAATKRPSKSLLPDVPEETSAEAASPYAVDPVLDATQPQSS